METNNCDYQLYLQTHQCDCHIISVCLKILLIFVQPFKDVKKTFLAHIHPFVLSHSVVFDSFRSHGLYPTRLLCPWEFPGKNTGVGRHFLLQGIFPTQGSNTGLLFCKRSPALQADSLPTEPPCKPIMFFPSFYYFILVFLAV